MRMDSMDIRPWGCLSLRTQIVVALTLFRPQDRNGARFIVIIQESVKMSKILEIAWYVIVIATVVGYIALYIMIVRGALGY